MEYINQGPEFIAYLVKELNDYGVLRSLLLRAAWERISIVRSLCP